MIKNLFEKIIKPKSKDEDKRKHEFILNILLVCTIILLSIVVILNFLSRMKSNFNPDNSIQLSLLILILFIHLFLYFLSRKGFLKFSALVFIGIYFLLSSYMIYLWGIEVQASLLFLTLSIVLSGVLIGTRFSFFIAALSILVLSFGFILQEKNIYTPDLIWKTTPWGWIEIIIVSIIFLIISAVSWLFNREIEKSLKRAIKSEKELKKEKDMLEIKIEERTKELKKNQMEKIAQMHKCAEFGKLSRGLFHDLINPLNAIYLNVEKLKNTKQLDNNFQGIKDDIEKTIRATNKMKDFINSIKKQMIQKENSEIFSIRKEIKESIEILKYRTMENNIKILLEDSEDIKILGDPIKFNQVIINLINNSIDSYLTTDKEILIKNININLTKKNNYIIIKVIDNGCGISKDIINKIFEPFFTTKNFKKNKHSGIGIGLSLSKQIIEKDFNGKIEVQSKKNNGTKFIINFPLTEN